MKINSIAQTTVCPQPVPGGAVEMSAADDPIELLKLNFVQERTGRRDELQTVPFRRVMTGSDHQPAGKLFAGNSHRNGRGRTDAGIQDITTGAQQTAQRCGVKHFSRRPAVPAEYYDWRTIIRSVVPEKGAETGGESADCLGLKVAAHNSPQTREGEDVTGH